MNNVGQINWTPTAADLTTSGPGHYVEVTVADPYGAVDTRSFYVTVVADTEAPKVDLLVAPGVQVNLDEEMTFLVSAVDNVKVTAITLTLVGSMFTEQLTVAANGVARYTPTRNEPFRAIARASDAAGNTASASEWLFVINPEDLGAPEVSLAASLGAAIITAPTNILGSISDPDNQLTSWTLSYAELNSDDFKVIHHQASILPAVLPSVGAPNDPAILAQFDPTLLANGSYVLRLSATDLSGNISTDERIVEVEGRLKLGNFTVSFTDLELPVPGFPITVTRSYDSLRASTSGDFGHGWSLDVSTTQLKVVLPSQQLSLFNDYVPFRDGTRVIITLPDGSTEGFTFYGEQMGSFGLYYYLPRFLPDIGVRSTLSVPHVELAKDNGTGEYYLGYGAGYNPAFVEESYTLTTLSGQQLTIDTRTGALTSVTDRTGNTLFFTCDGIQSFTGRGVQFVRDSANRITKIIDPRGNYLLYEYSPSGDLLRVYDRSHSVAKTNPTEFVYSPTRPHYLDEIRDPLGRSAASTEYDEEGRIKKLIDAAGQEIIYSYDTGTLVQTITNQLGHATQITLDDRGNVIREVDAAGGIMRRTFDAQDNLLSETIVVGLEDSAANGEANDLTTIHTYDSFGSRLTTIDPGGNITASTYNEFGQPETVTDALGNTTTSEYDSGLLTSVRDANGNTTSLSYDHGNLRDVRNDEGIILVSNCYNQFGEVVKSTPAAGRTTHFDYNVNGDQIASWYFEGEGEDEVQIIDRTTYDDDRRVIKTERVSKIGTTETVLSSNATVYDAVGQVTSTTNELGQVTEHTYDPRGRLIETRMQSTNETGTVLFITRTVYDAAGQAIATTDPYLHPYVEGTSEPITGTITTYDAVGRVTKTEQRRGLKVSINALGENVLDNPGTLVTDATTTYDNAGRVSISEDANGLETHTTYNLAGQVTQTRRESRDQSSNENGAIVWLVTRTAYDNYGRVELVTDQFVVADPYAEATSPLVRGTRNKYDAVGRVARSERLDGVQVSLTGGETAITNQGTLLSATETVYNEKGQVKQSIAANGQTTDYEYDSLGRRVAVIGHPVVIAGVTVRHRAETVYDALGRVSIERTNIRQLTNGTIDASQARETTYTYDEFDRVIQTTFDDDTVITTTYDKFGRKTSETNQLGQMRRFEYDAVGRLNAVELPAVPDPHNGNAPTRPRYEYGYNGQGLQTLIRDPLDRETHFTFDARGLQLSRTLPVGVANQGDPDDFIERFEYDNRGRQVLHVSFEGVVAQNIYDAATGRLKETKFFDNEDQYANGQGQASETWTYKYDAFGRHFQVTQDAGPGNLRTTTTSYDAEGRVTRIVSLEGAINYRYDALGRRIRTFIGEEADPVEDIHYTYDALGRLATVAVHERNNQTLAQPETTTHGYDLLGNVGRIDKPNGAIESYKYDLLNRLDILTHYATDGDPENLANNTKLAEFDYTVRADGKRTAATETFWFDDNQDTILDAHVNQLSWEYDSAGRLVEEVFNHYDNALDFTAEYIHDLVGNRLSKSIDKGNDGSVNEKVTSTFDADDRLLTESLDSNNDGDTDQTTTHAYSVTQHASKEVTVGGVVTQRTTNAYDLQGRMATVTIDSLNNSGGLTRREKTTFDYDSVGIRVKALHEVDDIGDGDFDVRIKTEYLNDASNHTDYSQVLKDTVTDAATGQVQNTTVYTIGLDQISQTTIEYSNGQFVAEETLLFGPDGHGSTRVLHDMAAAVATVAGVQQLFHFDAYGNALGFNPAQAATSVLYSGEHFDTNIQLQYLRARWYDPSTGRFNRLDPHVGNLQEPQSLHKYLYTHGDPIQFGDPSGLFEGLIGALFAANIQSVVSNLDVQAGQAALDSVGYTDFYLDPRDYLVVRAASLLGALIPQSAKDGASDFINSLGWSGTAILGGAVVGSVLGIKGLGNKIGVHQQVTSQLLQPVQRLTSQIQLIERVAEIAATFHDPAKIRTMIAYKEALGLARLEKYTGRVLREATDAAHDAIDGVLQKIQLKGPLIDPVTKKLIVNEQTINGLYHSVVKSARQSSGYDTLVVDLVGLTSDQAMIFAENLKKEALPKPILVLSEHLHS